jgi:hypothetical protein
MGERAHNPPPGFDDWCIDVPVPDWHQDVLDDRLDDLAANPDDESTWEQVEGRLRTGLAKKE